MDIEKIEAVLAVASLLLPGFITVSIFRMLVPSKDLIDQRGILSYLAFTALNYALFYWLIFLYAPLNSFPDRPFRSILVWVFVYFIGPSAIGVLLGVIWQNDLARIAFSKIGIRLIHHIPDSWDYMFDSIREPSWMLVTLVGGGQIAGFFGTKSFASSDSRERDLFLEQVYSILENGEWLPDDPGKGVWLSQRDIRLITLWHTLPQGNSTNVK